MKKSLLILCSAVLAFAGCTEKVKIEDSLTLKPESPTSLKVPKEGQIVNVEFKSTLAWTASLDVQEDVATVSPKSGEATPKDAFSKVKVSVTKNATTVDRAIKLTVKCEGLPPVTVTINQESQWHLKASQESLSIGKDGGELSFTLDTNVPFEMKTYEDFNKWSEVKADGNKYTITVKPNNSYYERQGYVKFTTTQEGFTEPVETETGTVDKPVTIRVYFNQECLKHVNYAIDIHDMNIGKTVISEAVYNGKHYVCDGNVIYEINPADGKYAKVELGGKDFKQKVITNDDAGNLIICTHTAYEKEAYIQDFIMNVVNKDGEKNVINVPAWKVGGPAGARICVRGDATKNALVTVPVEGIVDVTMSKTVTYWTIKDGVAGALTKLEVNGMEATWGTDSWNTYPGNFVSIASIGLSAEEGFIVSGAYEGNNIYKVDGKGNASLLFKPHTEQSGNYAYQTIDVRKIGGKPYLVSLASTHFPQWGLPPVISLVELENVTPGKVIHDVAIINKAAANFFKKDSDENESPFSDIKLYDDNGKIGVALVDINGKCMQSFTFDPAVLK